MFPSRPQKFITNENDSNRDAHLTRANTLNGENIDRGETLLKLLIFFHVSNFCEMNYTKYGSLVRVRMMKGLVRGKGEHRKFESQRPGENGRINPLICRKVPVMGKYGP